MKRQEPMTEMRYNEEKGIYRDCKWCEGRGCILCPEEAEKDYKKLLVDGKPEPIVTFDTTTIDGQVAAKEFVKNMLTHPSMECNASDLGGILDRIANLTIKGREEENGI